MIGDAIAASGGRKLFFAAMVFFTTGALLWFGKLDGDQWVTYNMTMGLAYMGANAVSKFSAKTGEGK